MVGRQPDIVMWYRDFPQPLLYSNEAANLRATGQTPMITWEPYEQSLSGIASGVLRFLSARIRPGREEMGQHGDDPLRA